MLKVQRFVFNLFHENTYLIWDNQSNEAAVIDPGMYDENEKKAFDDFVAQNHLNLQYCIITHCHIDHIVGNAYIKSKYNSKIVMPKGDIHLLKIMEEISLQYGMKLKPIPQPDVLIEDVKEFNLGGVKGKFLFTPGHSPGEHCIYFESEKVLFSGDVLFKESIGRADLWDGNHKMLLTSIISKLYVLPEDVIVYPGHESSTTIGYEKKNNPYVTV